MGRPCLLGYIDKCSAPCVGRVDADPHRQIAEDFCDFMAGETGRFLGRLTKEMKGAAAELDFERAARLRDDIGALEKVLEKSAVVLPDATDADVFALAEDELEVAVQLFHVRGGRVRGQRGWVAERDAETTPELVEHLLQQVYGGETGRGRAPRGARAGPARRRRRPGRMARRPARPPGRPAGPAARRQAHPDGDGRPQRLSRAWPDTRWPAPATSRPAARRCSSSRRSSTSRRPRCASSASTSATCRAPRSSARWSSSRTACPASPSTAASSSRGDETGATDDTAAMHEVLTRRFRAQAEPRRRASAPPTATATSARRSGTTATTSTTGP